MNLEELKAFRSEQITEQNCFAMKSQSHCQRCLVYSECLIYEGSIQSKFPFPQFWPQRLHEASTTWHLDIPQPGFRAKCFWALLRRSFGSRLWQKPRTRAEQKSCHAYLYALIKGRAIDWYYQTCLVPCTGWGGQNSDIIKCKESSQAN